VREIVVTHVDVSVNSDKYIPAILVIRINPGVASKTRFHWLALSSCTRSPLFRAGTRLADRPRELGAAGLHAG